MLDEIQFEGEEDGRPRFAKPTPMITRWVIIAGLAKDEAGAVYVLLTITVLILAVAGAIFWRTSANSAVAPVLPHQKTQRYPPQYYQPGGAAVPAQGASL